MTTLTTAPRVRTAGRPSSMLATLVAALLLLTVGATLLPSGAVPGLSAEPAAAQTLPATAVLLGDSFGSGQAGRWRGNSEINSGSRGMTDMAYTSSGYDKTRVYEASSIPNSCHRAFSAPIHALAGQAGIDKTVNLACNGARAHNLWPLANGGVGQGGEMPQLNRLYALAGNHDVDLIALSVGGNDMGFRKAIESCAAAWAKKHWTTDDDASCIPYLRDTIVPELGNVWYKVAKTIDLVRQTMAERGENGSDYRIVLLGYPAIIPDFGGFKYAAGDRRVRQCPFNGPDAQWIHENLMPKLNSTFEAIAHEKGVGFINLERAFDGHRLCQHGTRRSGEGGSAQYVSDTDMEWVRYLDFEGTNLSGMLDGLWRWANDAGDEATMDALGIQGTLTESLHPNAYGQQAIGTCISRYWAQGAANKSNRYRCTNGSTKRSTDMVLSLLPAPTEIGGGIDVAIKDNSSFEYMSTVLSGSEPGAVARAEIAIDHPRKGQLDIRLIDPNGREHVVKTVNANDTGAFPALWRSFWQDAPLRHGTWRLRVTDTATGYTGYLRDWRVWFF